MITKYLSTNKDIYLEKPMNVHRKFSDEFKYFRDINNMHKKQSKLHLAEGKRKCVTQSNKNVDFKKICKKCFLKNKNETGPVHGLGHGEALRTTV